MSKNLIAIIPSRYASTRFPGKPLVDIGGKPMIQRVYEQVIRAVGEVWVATDDQRIFDVVTAFGGRVVMTSDQHRSGTDRCAEAVRNITDQTGKRFDVVINVQGDEPFIQPDQILTLARCFDDATTEIATLVQKLNDIRLLLSPMCVKVVLDKSANGLYFSRQPIPMGFKSDAETWLSQHTYYRHVGIYAYRMDVLNKITALPEGSLERMESLEQLRWLENGYRIKTGLTDHESIGIDTPDDLARVLEQGVEHYYR